jgi:hypothetical protein
MDPIVALYESDDVRCKLRLLDRKRKDDATYHEALDNVKSARQKLQASLEARNCTVVALHQYGQDGKYLRITKTNNAKKITVDVIAAAAQEIIGTDRFERMARLQVAAKTMSKKQTGAKVRLTDLFVEMYVQTVRDLIRCEKMSMGIKTSKPRGMHIDNPELNTPLTPEELEFYKEWQQGKEVVDNKQTLYRTVEHQLEEEHDQAEAVLEAKHIIRDVSADTAVAFSDPSDPTIGFEVTRVVSRTTPYFGIKKLQALLRDIVQEKFLATMGPIVFSAQMRPTDEVLAKLKKEFITPEAVQWVCQRVQTHINGLKDSIETNGLRVVKIECKC